MAWRSAAAGGAPRATWAQLADISIDASEAWLRTRAGAMRRIDLADLENPAEARAALEFARQRVRPPDDASPGARSMEPG